MDEPGEDLYAVLGVAPSAQPVEISRAYRRLARALHPDARPDDPAAAARFARIGAAYRVLADSAQRARYDRLRRLAGEATPADPLRGTRIPVTVVPPTSSPVLSTYPFDTTDGLFTTAEALRGRRGSTQHRDPAAAREPAASCDVVVGLADSLRGATLTVAGLGGHRIRLPAGVRDGQRIRVRRNDDDDEYLTVRVRPDPVWRRQGDDLHISVPVTFPEAVTGTRLTIDTPHAGSIAVDVSPGTASGSTLCVPGAGAPTTRGSGDLFVTVVIDVPTDLDERQRTALAALAAALPCPRPTVEQHTR